MSATIEIICYKWKVLKNNENPLMLRVTKDRKKKYLSIGVSTKPEYWDFEKNRPKPNCPNKEYIETIISNKLNEYNLKILEYKVENKDFTAKGLVEKLNNPVKARTVKEVFDEQIRTLKTANRLNYALSFKHLQYSLERFNTHLDIYFSEIDITWLKRYEAWLRSEGNSENTIGIRFRTLRVLYNLAIERKLVKGEHYPFKDYKVSKLKEETLKRALSKEDIISIVNYRSNDSDPLKQLAVDLFTFSYLTAGINFVDMAYLTYGNIVENKLVYNRKKTHKLIKIPLQNRALELIAAYKRDENPHLFPILTTFHKTEQQKENRVRKIITKVNRQLKDIGKELGIQIDLTTYVARHSYATVLKRSGVSTAIISESLGHSSERVTQIYLDSFENSQIDAAMKNLL